MSALIKNNVCFMRMLFVLLTFLLIQNCGVSQNSGMFKNKELKQGQTICPEDGICTIEILKNNSLSLNYDTTGQLYPEFNTSENIVLKFEYTRNDIPNTEDDGYREIIYLEINKNDLPISLKHNELQNVKMLFARLCFCRGQTGYYKVIDGNLSISVKDNNMYELKLNFIINEVPQIINMIHEYIEL